MGLSSLPPSLDKTRFSLAAEVSFARSLSIEERQRVLAKVCQATMQILKLNSHKDELLKARDPVPESTTRAMQRLKIVEPG